MLSGGGTGRVTKWGAGSPLGMRWGWCVCLNDDVATRETHSAPRSTMVALPSPEPCGPHSAACSAWQRSFVASCQHSQPPAPTGVHARAAFRRPGCLSPAETRRVRRLLSSRQVAGLGALWAWASGPAPLSLFLVLGQSPERIWSLLQLWSGLLLSPALGGAVQRPPGR